MISYFI